MHNSKVLIDSIVGTLDTTFSELKEIEKRVVELNRTSLKLTRAIRRMDSSLYKLQRNRMKSRLDSES